MQHYLTYKSKWLLAHCMTISYISSNNFFERLLNTLKIFRNLKHLKVTIILLQLTDDKIKFLLLHLLCKEVKFQDSYTKELAVLLLNTSASSTKIKIYKVLR